MSAVLGNGLYRINKDHCPNTIKQASTYSWDSKAALHGKEQPIKANDHFPDAMRYVAYTMVPAWRMAA